MVAYTGIVQASWVHRVALTLPVDTHNYFSDQNELPTSASPQALIKRNPYTPARALVQRVVDHEPKLRRLLTVVDWLRETAKVPNSSVHQATYRKKTQREIINARQAGQLPTTLPKSLDPDVLNRETGVALYSEDAVCVTSLLSLACTDIVF